jgi:hypothetical protein
MSHPFKRYEVDVLERLLSEHYTREQLMELLDRAEPQKIEYTGYGFFVTATNPAIGRERRVCSDPSLVAESRDRAAGFVVFLEDGQLTLETFPPDGESLPADFREREVNIVATPTI